MFKWIKKKMAHKVDPVMEAKLGVIEIKRKAAESVINKLGMIRGDRRIEDEGPPHGIERRILPA